MFTPIAADRWLEASLPWHPPPAWKSRTFISWNPAWRIFSYIIREGVCGNELVDILRDARARRSRSAAELRTDGAADHAAAAAVRIHLRAGDDPQRVHAGNLPSHA